MYNKNLLQNINQQYTWADYNTFKTYLRLPLPYLVVLFKNFNRPHDMVYNLNRVIEKFHEHLWGKMRDKTINQKLYQIANIPPLYASDNKVIICNKPKEQELFDALVQNSVKLVGSGKQLYFHSDFMETAMVAASRIAKNAIDNLLGEISTIFGAVYCCHLGSYLEVYKANWDSTDPTIKNARESELLILYGVGNEYTTEFTSSYLFSLLDQRTVEGRSTILVSSLSPTQFTNRYGKEFVATVVEFKDNKIKQTLSDLVEELSK